MTTGRMLLASVLAMASLVAAATGRSPIQANEPPAMSADLGSDAAAEFAVRTTLDRSGRIVVPVMINGRGPFRFILDTGANRSAMSAATAELLGIDLASAHQASVHGITGSATLPLVLVTEFRAGELQLPDQRLAVLPADVFGGIDGILGIDAMQRARIEVDFERDVVTIRRSQGRQAQRGDLVVPARLRKGGLLLVQGSIARIPIKAILDTGAERSLGNVALFNALTAKGRLPPNSSTASVIGATPQIAEARTFAAPAIDIGGASLTGLTISFGDLHVFGIWSLKDEPALLIGMDLLGTLQRFVVDYPRREFHLRTWDAGAPDLTR
jgi:predicted aspartyl protease